LLNQAGGVFDLGEVAQGIVSPVGEFAFGIFDFDVVFIVGTKTGIAVAVPIFIVVLNGI